LAQESLAHRANQIERPCNDHRATIARCGVERFMRISDSLNPCAEPRPTRHRGERLW
jgi:hypothetical protein